MTDKGRRRGSKSEPNRRQMMAVAAASCLVPFGALAARTGPVAPPINPDKAKPTFSKDSLHSGMKDYIAIHGGKGKGGVKFFPFDGEPAPTNFLIYDLEPGASEGVHVHYLDNSNAEGAFDEYYFIISGEGQMEIDGEIVRVVEGDHIHTPLAVSHGIENTHPQKHLRVFLTYIDRAHKPVAAGRLDRPA